MPRIYASNNDPIDYCFRCFPGPMKAQRLHGDVGEGPDGRGNCFEYNAHHPDYGGCDYHCYSCRKPLDDDDNDAS